MAGVLFQAISPEITLSTSPKTVLQICAGTNHRVVVTEVSISFKGTSATAAPILVEVLRQTTAGTISSIAPTKGNSSDDESLVVTVGHTATAEPTASDVLLAEEIHPQTGYTWQAPFGGAIPVPGGGRLGIRATAAATVTVLARIRGEE